MASTLDIIYNEIDQAIGGADANQFFSLMIPGMILDPGRFVTGASSDQKKAFSELGNALYDVATATDGPNGLTLDRQYRSALGSLLPKVSPTLEAMRTKLRASLQQPTDWVGSDGVKHTSTKLDWFNSVSSDYAKVAKAWADDQAAAKQALEKQFTDPAAFEDAWNSWFATEAPAREAGIQQARRAVDVVFSPDELQLIDGLLDSGDDALSRAKQTLDLAGEERPGGAMVYAVDATPSDWPTLLQSDFGYVDLLASPEAIASQIALKQKLIDSALNNLNALQDSMPTTGTMAADLQSVSDQQDAYRKAQDDQLGTFADNAATAAKIYLSKKNKSGGDAADPNQTSEINTIKSDLDGGTPPTAADKAKTGGAAALTDDDVNKLVAGQKAAIAAQSAVQASSIKLADASLKAIGDKAEYANLKRYFAQLEQASHDVASLERQLATASAQPPQNIFPDTASERFTQLQIDYQQKNQSETTTLSTSFSQTNWSVSLFFGSASGEKSTSSSSFDHQVLSDETDVSIGMLLAKVTLQRDWYNPGVFVRSKDLRRIGDEVVSTGPVAAADYAAANDAVLPCFPVAFVIAKDITIKTSMNASQAHQVQSVMDSHESESGGFLCFSVAKTSADHQESKSFSAHVQGTDLIIRIPGAQVIGWYHEFVAKDESTPVTDDGDPEFASFAAAYRARQEAVPAAKVAAPMAA